MQECSLFSLHMDVPIPSSLPRTVRVAFRKVSGYGSRCSKRSHVNKKQQHHHAVLMHCISSSLHRSKVTGSKMDDIMKKNVY